MEDSERVKILKAFDETKFGVKGLVDAGITKIPHMFYHPPDHTKKIYSQLNILVEYMNQVMKLGTILLELLSEAFGLNPSYLIDIGCSERLSAFAHYYPACSETELTLGTIKHADVNFISVLLQDHIGGLQVLHKDMWIDVPPLSAALIVNIGDLLQQITNDELKSVHHRVPSNLVGPRVSIASFFGTLTTRTSRFSCNTFGPIEELLCVDDSARYKETSIQEFIVSCITSINSTSPRILLLKTLQFKVVFSFHILEDPCARKRVVESVRDASETFGFFQIVNHGIPLSTLEKIKDGVKSFFEQDSEVKKKFYTREHRPFLYNSNFNLYVFIEPVSPTRVN
ncbi:2OG-Fe(II) oxygenase family oxidoreductase [Medicago truncatula]|uniref:2OG-Fe(II) oxygenase family oxidoreductase n=1 Tax=Medicago truncatula TaxID=3880 RepID=G7I5I0_MEDTR|nr:2OG-Fe(II) oxygenase family oxidoreductase [Medicago truncatula]